MGFVLTPEFKHIWNCLIGFWRKRGLESWGIFYQVLINFGEFIFVEMIHGHSAFDKGLVIFNFEFHFIYDFKQYRFNIKIKAKLITNYAFNHRL